MGLVSFSSASLSRRPGLLQEQHVVDLSALSHPGLSEPFDARKILPHLPDVESIIVDEVDPASSNWHRVEEVELHPPVQPTKIVRLDGCYSHDVTDSGFNPHTEMHDLHNRDYPVVWIAPNSTLVGHESPVYLPVGANDVRLGAELVLVIGRDAKDLQEDEALDAVAGYTAAISPAVYDEIPGIDGYKSYDSFLPIGPQIVPVSGRPVDDVTLTVSINNETVDAKSTQDWRFTVGEMLAHVSEVMTLRTGDVILTGDPTRIERPVTSGDRVSVTVPAVGTLEAELIEEADNELASEEATHE